ncbi:unnamed protein product [Rotaria sordida]|uniref:MULE transposase domain-containing protein n=1 Tax=Rotaria sordida TaxID=392033 RepID=A0A813SBP0_9BILA|nr:unnamed protein product [Rotaria sordida]CAF1433036.1 unnamed protein product [Rotaria sordida]
MLPSVKRSEKCLQLAYMGRARYDDGIYTTYQDHICRAPDPDEIEKALYNYEIKKNAQQCHDPPRLIIQNARLKISLDAAINIPQYTASQHIIIPSNYQVNALNEQFLLYDNNDNQRRILIFATKQHLDFLNECESWHCDGTFAVAPKLFEQMYSIHGSIRGKKLPLLYSLLPNKDQKTYEELFRIVAQHELHLKKEFLENQNSRQTMKNLAALAFVPPNNIVEEFSRIKENASDVLDGNKLYILNFYYILSSFRFDFVFRR